MGEIVNISHVWLDLGEDRLIEEYHSLMADIQSTCNAIGFLKLTQALDDGRGPTIERVLELEEAHLKESSVRFQQIRAKLEGAGARSASSAPAGPAFPPAS